MNCLIELDKKSKLAEVAGYNDKQAFLISILSEVSANDFFGFFAKYVEAVRNEIVLDLDSTYPVAEGFLVDLLPVYGDYKKYQRIKGISCESTIEGGTAKCSYSGATAIKMTGLVATFMAFFGLYLH